MSKWSKNGKTLDRIIWVKDFTSDWKKSNGGKFNQERWSKELQPLEDNLERVINCSNICQNEIEIKINFVLKQWYWTLLKLLYRINAILQSLTWNICAEPTKSMTKLFKTVWRKLEDCRKQGRLLASYSVRLNDHI